MRKRSAGHADENEKKSSWFGRLFGRLSERQKINNLPAEQAERLIAEVKRRTAVKAVKIKIESAKNLLLRASKFGGVPYWNPAESYPKDDKGNKLTLLAQIDLAEIPQLPDFPEKGLLQFFILPDHSYGMDFDDSLSQKGWHVVWQENVDETVTEEAVLALDIPCTKTASNDDDFYMPLDTGYQLSFELTETFDGGSSFEFDKSLEAAAEAIGVEIPKHLHISEYIETDIFEANLCDVNNGHWIGGYPCFTQEDPRVIEKYAKHKILLLQIDTDEGIMWGDGGVGNFFITPEDLRKRDFSKVLYNWDCT